MCFAYVNLMRPVTCDGGHVAPRSVRAAVRVVGTTDGIGNRATAPTFGDLAAEIEILNNLVGKMKHYYFMEQSCN